VNITLVPCMTVGGAIGFVDSRGFDPRAFAAEVERRSATHSYLVPTQLYRLLDQLPEDSAQLSSIITLGYGAAPMSPDKAGMLVERFGPIFNQLYGMAEIASIGTMLRKRDHVAAIEGRSHLLRSAGQPSYAIDVRVVDEDGQDVEVGERGEVVFAAPYMMKGYFRDDKRTARTMIDGWIHSGDIAEVDADGFIYIVDRKKDLIIRGGYNISPTEIEAVLHRHPEVLEVAVIGIPDEQWGEAILATVATTAGASLAQEDLIDWCRNEGSLPTVKLPEHVEFLESLPKNAVGKIEKSALRARYWTDERKV
jgi:acyl-CoA synthetase (AMP-forming)/AMP-acid ligase II